MSTSSIKKVIGSIALLACTAFLMNGCAYLKNRGNDALDLFDLGVTANDHWMPGFGIYTDPFLVFPIGLSYVDARFCGLSFRRVSGFDYTNHSWGVVAWGREKRGLGPFDPTSPYQARKDQRELTERSTYDAGVIGLIAGKEPPPPRTAAVWKRGIHVGWLGIEYTCRFSEMYDFLVGWATFDPMSDDKY
jgi:hypothetical protein